MSNFYSLSKYPGKTGEHYYNSLFKKFDLPHTYTALECTDLGQSIQTLLDEGAAGFSISMPYKSEVIKYLSDKSAAVTKYKSCNTVINTVGELFGYSTDYCGAVHISTLIPSKNSIRILGDGNMGSMMSSLLGEKATIVARRTGNWEDRHTPVDVIINTTAYGTSTDESPIQSIPKRTKLVIDLAIKDNQLKELCAKNNVKYVPGTEFYKYQFLSQFQLYTGIKITPEDFDSV